MTCLQKIILWKFKPSNVVRSILAYKNCHTFRTDGFETDDEDSESSGSFGRSSIRHNRNPYFNRSNHYSKYNHQYGQSNYGPRYGQSNYSNRYGQSNFKRNDSYNSKFNLKHLDKVDRSPLLNEKFFYVEHPDIMNRSEDEVENYRKMMNMSISGMDVPKPITKFSELCLPESLTKCLQEENFTQPSAIQSQGWPIQLSGRDMIGVSQTGSGKTLAYMLPAIVHALNQEKIDASECMPRILVLGPTRELIQQIYEVSKKYLCASGLAGGMVYGGASKPVQLSGLQGAEVCIATPGRLIDFLSVNQVSMENVSFVVLDEADRMLDMGFEPQIHDIIDQIRPGRQTVMWSATWPTEIRELAKDFLSNYIHVTIGSGELVANPNIKQNIIITSERRKGQELYSLLENIFLNKKESKILIFAQTKRQVDHLASTLSEDGFRALGLHGDISQSRRDRILSSFRKNKSCILIATDVAARGLDITDVRHVINYDFPPNIEDYIHRIGRTARGEANGESHSFFTDENAGLVKKLLGVLKDSNQEIDPELYSLAQKNQKPVSQFNRFNNNRRRIYRNM